MLDHFHKAKDGKDPNQLLTLCPGASGMGKLQTMFSMLWHMSQHRPCNVLEHKVATYVYTSGIAMLIGTLTTNLMTMFQKF